MKHMIALAVLTVGLAIPSHAQTVHAAAGGSASLPATSGGGWGSGGMGGGSSAGNKLMSYPPTLFNVTSVSGSQQDYVPSMFVSYDRAIAAGQKALDTPPRTVAEAAREHANTRPEKAKLALVQNDHGKAVIVGQ
jgi:hypothetical protein